MKADQVHDTVGALYQVSKPLSILLFLYDGLGVLVSNAMVAEFERFGLRRIRTWARLRP